MFESLVHFIGGWFMLIGFVLVNVLAAAFVLGMYYHYKKPKKQNPTDVVDKQFDDIVKNQ